MHVKYGKNPMKIELQLIGRYWKVFGSIYNCVGGTEWFLAQHAPSNHFSDIQVLKYRFWQSRKG